MYGFLIGYLKSLLNRWNIHIIIVKHGVGIALTNYIQCLVIKYRVLLTVEPQRQLRHGIPYTTGSLHNGPGQTVCFLLVFSSRAAYYDPAVIPVTTVDNHSP